MAADRMWAPKVRLETSIDGRDEDEDEDGEGLDAGRVSQTVVAAPPEAAGSTEVADALGQPDAAPAVTREQRRSRRKRAIRAKTISVKRMTKRELELGRLLYPESEDEPRPRMREDCVAGERPCPFVSCKHHLYLDVSARTGAIKLNFPDLEVWEMSETCALDVADRGGTTLEEVGAIMNLTRERIRQVEVKGLAKLAALRDMMALRDYVDEGPMGKRRLPVLSAPTEDEEEREEDDDLDGADVEESSGEATDDDTASTEEFDVSSEFDAGDAG
jgi:hypothetical protein